MTRLFSVITATVVVLGFASFAHAGGLAMATEWSWTRDGGRIFNSVIVLGFFAWIALKYGGPILRKRAEDIAEQFENLKTAQETAAKNLVEYEKKIAVFEGEAKKIRAEAKEDAEAIKQKIIAQAKEAAELIMKKAEERIALEAEQARETLQRETTLTAVALAEEILKKNMGKGDQAKLVEEYLKGMEKAN